MKEKLISAMEFYFGRDQKRIHHAHRVLMYAEELLKTESGDQEVVIAAAILHDIGIHAAEKKHGSTAGKYQELEGPPVAEHILKRVDFPQEKRQAVLEIIAHHHTPGVIKTASFNVLSDADWMINIREEGIRSDRRKTAALIKKVFLTRTGKKLAQEMYLNNQGGE